MSGAFIKVGKKYKVNMQDCCVQGNFTATLTKILTWENDNRTKELSAFEGDLWDVELTFDNGVELTNCGATELTEV